MIFLIVQIVVVDLGEEILQAGLTSPNVDVAFGMNYITWTYVVAIIASSLAANIVFFGRKSLGPGLLASACTVAMLYLIGMTGFMTTYPGVALGPVGIVSAPTLFLSYVLRNIFAFQLLVVVIQVTFFTSLDAVLLKE
jgi:hypothetical protein